MVDITSALGSTTVGPSTAGLNTSGKTEAEESSISDFNDFLTLLTAQLRNQDPTKPLDSTQFVEQLASFSSVEQQVGTNKKLDLLIDQANGEQITELASWVGRNIDATKGLFELGADGLSLDIPEIENLKSLEAIVSDASGTEITRVSLAATDKTFAWDGQVDGGSRAANGQYAVTFNATLENDSTQQIEARAAGNVVEARIEDDGPILVLDTGALARIANIERVAIASTNTEEDT